MDKTKEAAHPSNEALSMSAIDLNELFPTKVAEHLDAPACCARVIRRVPTNLSAPCSV